MKSSLYCSRLIFLSHGTKLWLLTFLKLPIDFHCMDKKMEKKKMTLVTFVMVAELFFSVLGNENIKKAVLLVAGVSDGWHRPVVMNSISVLLSVL